MRCTEAVHWKCLSAVDQAEILRSARLREKQGNTTEDSFSGPAPPERQMINFDEMTDYICAACNQGGFCIECHRDLKTDARAVGGQDPKDGNVSMTSAEASGPRVESVSQAPTELLFRCVTCRRAAHYAHLTNPWTEEHADDPGFIEELATHYQKQYSWQCDDCSSYHNLSVDKIVAWRPYPANAPVLTPEEVTSKRLKDPWPREYLVKWADKGYRRTRWVPHLWLVSTTYQKLRHFILNGTKVRLEHLRSVGTAGEENGGAAGHDAEEIARRRVYEEQGGPPLPNPRAEECIPEPWKRIEQVLDVVLWAPHKRLKRIKGKQTKKGGKKSNIVHSSGSEIEEDMDAEEMKKLEALRERSRVTGTQHLGPDCTETPLARKRRSEGKSLELDDIDDVVWCYAKWGELEYQEGKQHLHLINRKFTLL
jgi:chromodomain-helicase-DNA-binding protein 4